MTHKNDTRFSGPDAKRAYNRRLFGVVSRRYATATVVLSWGRDAAWKRRCAAVALGAVAPGIHRFLDLACGSGDIAALLASRRPDSLVVGADLTPEMLTEARNRRLPANAVLSRQDMCRTAFRDSRFDCITGGYALRNAPALDALLAEVRRLLTPGGVAVFLEFNRCRNPLLWRIEFLLLKFWGDLWGLLLHGRPEIYAYIADSLRTYPDGASLRQMIRGHGFTDIHSEPLFFGIVAITSFRRPPD